MFAIKSVLVIKAYFFVYLIYIKKLWVFFIFGTKEKFTKKNKDSDLIRWK